MVTGTERHHKLWATCALKGSKKAMLKKDARGGEVKQDIQSIEGKTMKHDRECRPARKCEEQKSGKKTPAPKMGKDSPSKKKSIFQKLAPAHKGRTPQKQRHGGRVAMTTNAGDDQIS